MDSTIIPLSKKQEEQSGAELSQAQSSLNQDLGLKCSAREMVILLLNMAIFGNFGKGDAGGFMTCNFNISRKHPFAPQY